MINDIVQGVAAQLAAAFEGCKIYQNNVEQGLSTPCFFVALLKPTVKPLAQGRYFRRDPLDVHYFPAEGRDNAEMCRVAEELTECLEYITLPAGSRLRGREMSYELVDGVLHFFVEYDCIVSRVAPPPAEMGEVGIVFQS